MMTKGRAAQFVRAFGFLLCSLLALSCEKHERTGMPTAHAAEAERRRVVLQPSRRLELSEQVSATGTLRPQEQLLIKAEVSGRIASIAVDLGSPVKRGQVIAVIDATDQRLRVAQAHAALGQARALLGLGAEVDVEARSQAREQGKDVDVELTSVVRQAQATFEEARGNLERRQALFARKLIGRAELDAATASLLRGESALASAREEIYQRTALLKQRQAELALAQRALAYTSISSPIDGVVQARHIGQGELVAPGTQIVSLVDLDPLRLRLEIPERAASQVQLGNEVRIALEQDAVYTGRVARIAPVIDEQNRTLAVEAEFANPGLSSLARAGARFDVRAGSFVRAEIELGLRRQVLAVPSPAVVVFAGLEKVLRVEDGKVQEVVVTTGRRQDGYTEILSGLADGAEVIAEPKSLQTGDLVEPSEKQSRAEAR